MKNIPNKYKDLIEDMIFQNPFIGITITDGEGTCLVVNDAQTRITGMPKEVFLGKKLQNSVAERLLSNSSTKEILDTKGEVNLHQVTAKGKSYEVKGFPVFDDDGNIIYTISYLLDVTEGELFKKMVRNLKDDNERVVDKIKDLLKSGKTVGGTIYYGPKMREVVETAKKVAVSDATVLIVGPSGSGKELIADLIHDSSNRRDKPFIKLNCAAIPEQLLESELFGYEEGAFTGSSRNGHAGIFESANGGSLLLDEIGEMPLNLQSKILRILQDKQVRRIGCDKFIKVDVRIIASTNAPLEELIERKEFREDLYYRLNVIEIHTPSLSERSEDVPVLIAYFLNKFNNKYGMKKQLADDTVMYLTSREYKGNIRELKNVIERLVLQSRKNIINVEDAITILQHNHSICITENVHGFRPKGAESLPEMLEEYEKNILKDYIKTFGKLDIVSKELKIDRSTISRKIKKYGL